MELAGLTGHLKRRLDSIRVLKGTGRRWLPFFLAWIGICAAPICCSGGETISIDDEAVFGFGIHLYRQGEYYRSISEFRRLMYYFPGSPLTDEARLQIGRAYMAGGETETAADYWRDLLAEVEGAQGIADRIRILYGISLLDLDRALTFSRRAHHVETAVEMFSQIEVVDHQTARVSDFAAEWRQRPELPPKSPWLAGGLSAVLPGAGSFYTGRYREGLYAFFITGLFGLAAAEAFSEQQPELGIIFGFFGVAFYGGSIYTAVNSVHKYNDKQQANVLLRLRKKHGIWLIPATDHQSGHF